MKSALLLVDIQNDFIPGGALAVPDGDAVVKAANDVMKAFEIVIATRDWHPADHGSFASQHQGKTPGNIIELSGLEQILWPDHCVQNTKGAELVEGLNDEKITRLFYKGTVRSVDSYSAFFDNSKRKDTGLGDYLTSKGIGEVFIVGLATDYCVKYTALDAIELGLATKIIIEGVRGVELNEGDCEKALKEMSDAGARIISKGDLYPPR